MRFIPNKNETLDKEYQRKFKKARIWNGINFMWTLEIIVKQKQAKHTNREIKRIFDFCQQNFLLAKCKKCIRAKKMETHLKHNINHFHIRFTSESRNRFWVAEKWMKTRALSALSQRQSKSEASKLWHCMLIFWVSVIFCNNAFILSLSDVVQMHRMTLMCESWEKNEMEWIYFSLCSDKKVNLMRHIVYKYSISKKHTKPIHICTHYYVPLTFIH